MQAKMGDNTQMGNAFDVMPEAIASIACRSRVLTAAVVCRGCGADAERTGAGGGGDGSSSDTKIQHK